MRKIVIAKPRGRRPQTPEATLNSTGGRFHSNGVGDRSHVGGGRHTWSPSPDASAIRSVRICVSSWPRRRSVELEQTAEFAAGCGQSLVHLRGVATSGHNMFSWSLRRHGGVHVAFRVWLAMWQKPIPAVDFRQLGGRSGDDHSGSPIVARRENLLVYRSVSLPGRE